MACRLLSQARSGGEKKEHPMLDMADIARGAVPRKKSFLYTRRGDKGTSQVSVASASRNPGDAFPFLKKI